MADIDVSPGILEQMNQAIEANDASKRARNRLIVKAEKGQAIYKDAYDYAGLRGKAAADAIREIEESDLPNGRMYFNIADKTIRPVLEETSDEIFSYASQLLENVNEKAGIHLKPVLPNPEETAEKIKGVLGLASSNEHWNEVREETAQTVENFSKKCVDDHIRANAERQYEVGLSAKVVRTASRGACEWCENVAGSYEYAAVKGRGEDVWRRHANCDCVIEYEPVKGKRQTVSSGSYRQNKDSLSPEERERRAEEKAKNNEAKRSRNTRTETDLRKLSNSKIVNADTVEEAQQMMMNKYGFDVEFFEDQDVFAVKAVLAGYDDFLTEFPEAIGFIKSIDYDAALEYMGTMSKNGYSRVGPNGLGEYGTGLHESSHALDFAVSIVNGESFGDSVVREAIVNLGEKNYSQSVDQIIGMVSLKDRLKILSDNSEIYAYSMETSMGGIRNKFADEVFRITKERLHGKKAGISP